MLQRRFYSCDMLVLAKRFSMSRGQSCVSCYMNFSWVKSIKQVQNYLGFQRIMYTKCPRYNIEMNASDL